MNNTKTRATDMGHKMVLLSENSAIIACSLVVQMKEEVARNPSLTLGKRKKRSYVSYIYNLRRNQETGPG